jgi:hypothetical protein
MLRPGADERPGPTRDVGDLILCHRQHRDLCFDKKRISSMHQIVVLADTVEFEETNLFLIEKLDVKYVAVVFPSSMPS